MGKELKVFHFRDVRDQVNICKYLIYIRNRSRVLCKSWNVTFLTSVCFFKLEKRGWGKMDNDEFLKIFRARFRD